MKNIIYFILIFVFSAGIASGSEDSLDINSALIDTNSITEKASLYPLSQERKEELKSYSYLSNIWRFIFILLSIAVYVLVLFSGLSAKLRTWAQTAKYKFFILWLYLTFFLIINFLIKLPFRIYRGFIVETDYGFMNLSFFEWLSESLMSLGLTILIAIIPIWFIYYLIGKSKRWWLRFSLGAIPFIIFSMIVFPIFVEPLFNKFEPLKDELLKTELLSLAEKAGIKNPDLFQINASKQSSRINAYVTGIFNSKRIVLYDTIIDNFTLEEIKFTMGHEMGHYVKHHIWHGIIGTFLFILFAFWLTNKFIHSVINKFQNRFKFNSLSDIASLPLLLLFIYVIYFFGSPVINTISRYNEHQADIYGMEITDITGEAAAVSFDKFTAYNLSDPDPHPIIEFWFYTHPSLKKRMEFVRNFRP